MIFRIVKDRVHHFYDHEKDLKRSVAISIKQRSLLIFFKNWTKSIDKKSRKTTDIFLIWNRHIP